MPKKSIKHLQIDKANHTVVIAAAVGVSILVFGLFTGRAIWSRYAHQERVIEAKSAALVQLEENVKARDMLVESYKTFVNSSAQNLIGGDVNGTELKDGDNARLILDALPSKYDFPALATALSTTFSSEGYKIESMSGTDEEATYSEGAIAPIANEEDLALVDEDTVLEEGTLLEGEEAITTVDIPIGFELTQMNYESIQNTIKLLDTSIRPLNIQRLKIEGGGNSMTLTVNALTYYQPETFFNLGTETIK